MTHRRSEFKSRGKTGKRIDLFLAWVLIAQICLIAWKLGNPGAYPWWAAFTPLYLCIGVPLLLIAFGMGTAARSKK